MSKVTATYLTSNATDWIHLAPHGMAFQVTPELLRAYLAPDVDWGDWKPSLHDDGVAGPVEGYGEIVAVRHYTGPVEVLDPETWARRLVFHGVEADPVTRIDWDTTSDPTNPGWVARQGRLNWPVQGCEPNATDAELVDAANAWAPAGVTVAAAEVDRTEAPECVTVDNFRAILDGLGYYNGDVFGSPEQVREYLSASNLLDVFGEVTFPGAALARLAELAIEHREHYPDKPRHWRIESTAGEILGTYPGADKAEALDAMARDAGHRDYTDACETTGDDPEMWAERLIVVEVDHA